jgi:hypothetical protein
MRSHGNGHHSPQEETLAMIALGGGGSGPLLAAHASADNAGIVTSSGTTPVVLASVTVTPRVSGKFQMVGTVLIDNTSDSTTLEVLGFGHAAGAGDYFQVGYSAQALNTFPGALTADNDLTGQVFPLGTPVTLTFLLKTSVGGATSLTVAAHNAQLSVVEMMN